MYYLFFSLGIAAFAVLHICLIHKLTKKDLHDAAETYRHAVNATTAREKRKRKQRVRTNLKPSHRFLYNLWFAANMTILFLPMILLPLGHIHVVRYVIAPPDAIYIEPFSYTDVFVEFGGLFFAPSLMIGFDWLTNRGIIRRADMVYHKGSFREYPRGVNLVISLISGTLSLVVIMLCLNKYTYLTDSQIVRKPVFALEAEEYSYSEILYVERTVSQGTETFTARYHFFTADGTELTFGNGSKKTDQMFEELLVRQNLEVRGDPYPVSDTP